MEILGWICLIIMCLCLVTDISSDRKPMIRLSGAIFDGLVCAYILLTLIY